MVDMAKIEIIFRRLHFTLLVALYAVTTTDLYFCTVYILYYYALAFRLQAW